MDSAFRNAEGPPAAERTVGQLVAETIRLYRGRFFPSLALGVVVATFNQLAIGQAREVQAMLLALAAPLFALAYIAACALVAGERPPRRAFFSALVVGVVVFLPVGLLVWIFILPALAWLAFAGLSVPAALLERAGYPGCDPTCRPPGGRGLCARARRAGDARHRLLRQPQRAAAPPARAGGRRSAHGGVSRRPRALAAALPGLGCPVFRPEGPVRVGLPTTKEARCPSTSC